ncbi:hypothetical protein JMJ35_010535 [Cladonia borealis]|uniref:Uncharacterized protein n=1 Tax=Cladonia borealis TaxID=184061 RepID=A0AA39QQ48_9LECA|nr:hypothetical protein JMJ35_010535 [Cladonia borealis]
MLVFYTHATIRAQGKTLSDDLKVAFKNFLAKVEKDWLKPADKEPTTPLVRILQLLDDIQRAEFMVIFCGDWWCGISRLKRIIAWRKTGRLKRLKGASSKERKTKMLSRIKFAI